MIPGINNSILQFFPSADFRHHLKYYAKGLKRPVVCYLGRMPPWQIIRETGAGAGSSITMTRLRSTNPEQTVPTTISGTELEVVATGTGDVIVYKGIAEITNSPAPTGHYYLIVQDSFGNSWTSELFCMVNSLDNYLKISWWHNVNFPIANGELIYHNGFRNIMYLESDLGKPNYEIFRRTLPRGGTTFKIFQRWKKVFNFSTIVTEGMADVMTLIGLHHNVEITYNGSTYIVHDFVPADPQWLKEGDLANLDCRVEIGAITSQTGSALSQAEYNDDYGDDYTI